LDEINFQRNAKWPSDAETQMLSLSKALFQIISEKCRRLKRLVLARELPYIRTLANVIRRNVHITHLTLKRNVPYNMFLHSIGKSCPNLKELDIAGADVVTDFGVVCLLYDDPEQVRNAP